MEQTQLRRVRRLSGLTLRETAARTGLKVSRLHTAETGKSPLRGHEWLLVTDVPEIAAAMAELRLSFRDVIEGSGPYQPKG